MQLTVRVFGTIHAFKQKKNFRKQDLIGFRSYSTGIVFKNICLKTARQLCGNSLLQWYSENDTY